MTSEEIKVANEQKRAQLQVLSSELSQIKPGRKVYVAGQLGTPINASSSGQVLFETKDLNRLKSNVAKELKKLQA